MLCGVNRYSIPGLPKPTISFTQRHLSFGFSFLVTWRSERTRETRNEKPETPLFLGLAFVWHSRPRLQHDQVFRRLGFILLHQLAYRKPAQVHEGLRLGQQRFFIPELRSPGQRSTVPVADANPA